MCELCGSLSYRQAGNGSGEESASLDAIYSGTPSTTNVMIAGLISGDQWATGQTIKYYFDNSGSSAWTAAEMSAYRAALQSWANVANLTFLEVNSAAAADFIEKKFNEAPPPGGGGVTLGRHELPNMGGTATGEFNQSGYGWTTAGLQSGGTGFATLVHELGHALGLDHPHPETGATAAFPGVTSSSSLGDNNLNQIVFTVMSYNHGWDQIGAMTSNDFGDAAGPMAFDIAAIQLMYGANTSYRTGNDTYTLPSANATGTGWICIWDAGGTDEIVYGGSVGVMINLTAASIANEAGGGGSPSYVEGIQGGFTIANGAVIENASGGAGNDIIVGNRVANLLSGNGGNDNMFGAGGGDTIHGGGGDDNLYGDAFAGGPSGVGMGSGTLNNPGTNTTIATAADLTNLFSLASNANIEASTTRAHVTVNATTPASGTVGPAYYKLTVNARTTIHLDIDGTTTDVLDTLISIRDASNNTLAENDDKSGDAGSTNIRDSGLSFTVATAGTYYIQVRDWYVAGLPNNASFQLHVSVADPVAYGGDGVAGNDSLSGGAGNDWLDGGIGTDTLIGGTDNDTYVVDTYADVIIENANEGTDTVRASDNYIAHANIENVVLTNSAARTDAIGNDLANTITGSSASNAIDGGQGNDTIVGGSGSDTLEGGSGNDSMSGGAGIDVFYVDSAGDTVAEVVEAVGGINVYDTVWTTVSYTLPDNVEIVILNGGTLAINAIGNDGTADNTPNLMLGNNAANTITSYGGDDILMGRDGNDVLNSGTSGNGLNGTNGYDMMAGGRGNDTLTGGLGHDYFNFTNIDEAGDTITDFTTNAGVNDDILDLRAMWGTFTNTAGLTTSAHAVASGHLTFTQSGTSTLVYADADGGANGNVLLATLLNTTAANVQAYTLIA